MASKPQPKDSGAPNTPTNQLIPVDDGGLAKFTYNIRGGNESLTIRCDSEEELKILRDRWKAVISPPRRKLPYMHSGDDCLVENCGGTMVTRTGTNRKTQQPYQFLRCSNNPEDAPISPAQANALKNGGNGVANTAQAASVA
jgi:hypothetical protein